MDYQYGFGRAGDPSTFNACNPMNASNPNSPFYRPGTPVPMWAGDYGDATFRLWPGDQDVRNQIVLFLRFLRARWAAVFSGVPEWSSGKGKLGMGTRISLAWKSFFFDVPSKLLGLAWRMFKAYFRVFMKITVAYLCFAFISTLIILFGP